MITFPPEGAFIVDSSVAVEGDQRIGFKFTSAKLKLPGRDVKLPPFGQVRGRPLRPACAQHTHARAHSGGTISHCTRRNPSPRPQGWFDTVYIDDRIRVAQDSRGDTLVVERDGPPRIFT